MNAPAHIACGACLAFAIARAARGRRGSPGGTALVAGAVVAAGVVSHLVLDLLPHYAWIVYLDWFKPMPNHWLVREAVFGLAAGAGALWLADGERPWVMLGMVADMYPDVEKVLFFNRGVADAFILFDWHSKYLSNRTGGLPKPVLIAFECSLIAACLFTIWRVGRGARRSGGANETALT